MRLLPSPRSERPTISATMSARTIRSSADPPEICEKATPPSCSFMLPLPPLMPGGGVSFDNYGGSFT